MEQSIQIQLEEIKETDILIGIPSYNNSEPSVVVWAVNAGLGKFRSLRKIRKVRQMKNKLSSFAKPFEEMKPYLIEHWV